MPHNTSPSKAFLVFSGSNTRAIVAFCRALAARGLDSHIVARTKHDPIFKTRYRRNVVAVRAGDRLDFQDIARCLEEARHRTGAQELIIGPTSEFFNRFLLENPAFFANHGCVIPLVNLDLYRRVSDKYSFSRICQSQGVPVPRELPVDAPPQFPFVAKPLYNVNAQDRSLYPYLIYGPDDLAHFRQNEDPADFYLEEFIVGSSFYLLYYLSRRGEVSAFSQQNLAQQPDGKSIVLARTAYVHQHPIAHKFADILQGLGFWGLAMVEIILRDDEFVFIELNPRFWGPFQLLINAGSPIIDRFIEDHLGLPLHASVAQPKASYLWFGGMLDSLAAGKKLHWYINPSQRNALFVARHWRSDVYLQRDTGKLFMHEVANAARAWINHRHDQSTGRSNGQPQRTTPPTLQR